MLLSSSDVNRFQAVVGLLNLRRPFIELLACAGFERAQLVEGEANADGPGRTDGQEQALQNGEMNVALDDERRRLDELEFGQIAGTVGAECAGH